MDEKFANGTKIAISGTIVGHLGGPYNVYAVQLSNGQGLQVTADTFEVVEKTEAKPKAEPKAKAEKTEAK